MKYDVNVIKGAMVFIILAATISILMLLSGCATTYHVEVTKPDGTRVLADSRSYREFALFQLAYDPAVNLFTVTAVGVTDDTAEVVGQAVGVVGAIADSAVKANLGQVNGAEATD